MNLRETYGRLYRVALDPSATSWHDPAMHTIPTRTGCVYCHSEDLAGVEIGSRFCYRIAELHRRGYHTHQRGDDVTTLLVPWSTLPDVLPLLLPFKRRQVSEAERERLAAISQGTRFGRRDGTGDEPQSDRRLATPSVDAEPASTPASDSGPVQSGCRP
jgi:hypothetical protein